MENRHNPLRVIGARTRDFAVSECSDGWNRRRRQRRLRGPSETRELTTQEKHYDYDDDPRRLLLTVDFSPLARVFPVVHLQRQKWPLTALLNWSSTSNSGPHFILLFLLFYNHATNFDAIEK